MLGKLVVVRPRLVRPGADADSATRDLDLATDVRGMAVSSGVPSVTFELRRLCERYLDLDPVVLGAGVRTGMPVLYDNPKEVGADRIANAVAAFERFGGPTIVVDFGTATTVDAISANGEYLGGAIVPGIEISLDALFGRAAALRRVELVAPKHVIGKSTVESIQAGAVYGFTGQVDAIVDRIARMHGGKVQLLPREGGGLEARIEFELAAARTAPGSAAHAH